MRSSLTVNIGIQALIALLRITITKQFGFVEILGIMFKTMLRDIWIHSII